MDKESRARKFVDALLSRIMKAGPLGAISGPDLATALKAKMSNKSSGGVKPGMEKTYHEKNPLMKTNGKNSTQKIANNRYPINNGKNTKKYSMLVSLPRIFALFILLLLIASPAFAIKQLITLQGKVDKSGVLVNNGNLTVSIWDSPSGGTQLYIDYFNGSIQNGIFDVVLGNGTVLNLNNSETYYIDLAVNATDLDFEGNERKIFQSPVGYKISGSDNFSVDTDVLFVDSLNNRIGIGTTSPSEKLKVSGNVIVTGALNASEINASKLNNFVFINDSRIGIGTTGPQTKLHLDQVSNDRTGGIYIERNAVDYGLSLFVNAGGYGIIGSNGGFTKDILTMDLNTGSVGIGGEPDSALEISDTDEADNVLLLIDNSGTCEAQPSTTGLTWSCSSDARLKTNIRSASPVLGYISKIPLKDYTVIKTGENATGPIAQEVLKTNSELVRQGDDGYYQVSELSQWTLVKAIQELKAENEQLKNRIEALERRG